MGDILDERGNIMPMPGNGRAKRARIDREGNLVAGGKVYAYDDTGLRNELTPLLPTSDIVVNSITANVGSISTLSTVTLSATAGISAPTFSATASFSAPSGTITTLSSTTIGGVNSLTANQGSFTTLGTNTLNATSSISAPTVSATSTFSTPSGTITSLSSTTIGATTVNTTSVNTTQLTSNGVDNQILVEDSANADKQYSIASTGTNFVVEETGIQRWLQIIAGEAIQFGGSAIPNSDTNGIYRLGSKNVINRNLIISLTGIRTVTFTVDCLGFRSNYQDVILRVSVAGIQSNGSRRGGAIGQYNMYKAPAFSSAWLVDTLTSNVLAGGPTITVDNTTSLVNQFIVVITTPDLLAEYNLHVNIETEGMLVLTGLTTVVT